LTGANHPDRTGVRTAQATSAIRIDIPRRLHATGPLLVTKLANRRRPAKRTAQSRTVGKRYTSVFVLIPGENFFKKRLNLGSFRRSKVTHSLVDVRNFLS
jgi:hypothetical protein